MNCDCSTCYTTVYYSEEACSEDDKRGCNTMAQKEKTMCPHYDEDNICDCPCGVEMHPVGVCPPAEQIKDNLFEAWLDMKREREQSEEQLEELYAELEREREKGWNR